MGGRGTGMPTFACGITPAPSSQARLGVLPSPQGTVLFLSPRQVGRERAQPRRKSPGSSGQSCSAASGGVAAAKRKAPHPVSRGTSRQPGLQPSGCPECSLQNQRLFPSRLQSLWASSAWEMGVQSSIGFPLAVGLVTTLSLPA